MELHIPPIPQERLVGDKNLIKKIVCPLCTCIFKQPLMCNKCMNMWCLSCLKDDYFVEQSCPRKCENVQLLQSPPLLNDILSLINIQCINKLCPDVKTVEEYSQHYLDCPFRLVLCPVDECMKEMANKEFIQHQKECPSREILLKQIQKLNKQSEQIEKKIKEKEYELVALETQNKMLMTEIQDKDRSINNILQVHSSHT
ncbi:hypothetical protein ABPG72_005556 [Tetrahymena utriculariae]